MHPVEYPLEVLHRGADDLPFVSEREGYEFQLPHIDVAQGLWVIHSRLGPGLTFNRHRHTGPVLGFTRAGCWRYREQGIDYTAGSYVFEPAGSVHTFTTPDDGAETTDVWFAIWGANLQLDAAGEIFAVTDAASILERYLALCEEHGHPRPNIIGV